VHGSLVDDDDDDDDDNELWIMIVWLLDCSCHGCRFAERCFIFKNSSPDFSQSLQWTSCFVSLVFPQKF